VHIVELSCVEDKEELVNIGKRNGSFDVSCQIIVCLTHCIINMDTKGKSGSIWTMDEEMLLIEQSKLKDEELCGKLMADTIGISNKRYRGSPKPIFLK